MAILIAFAQALPAQAFILFIDVGSRWQTIFSDQMANTPYYSFRQN